MGKTWLQQSIDWNWSGVPLQTSLTKDKPINGLVKPNWINSRVNSSHVSQAGLRPGNLVLNLRTVLCCVQTCSDWSLTRAGGQTSGNWGCCWGTASRCPACWARSRRSGVPTPNQASAPASRLPGTRYILYCILTYWTDMHYSKGFIEALNFLSWMKQEPQSMVWLPVLHR